VFVGTSLRGIVVTLETEKVGHIDEDVNTYIDTPEDLLAWSYCEYGNPREKLNTLSLISSAWISWSRIGRGMNLRVPLMMNPSKASIGLHRYSLDE